MKKPKKQNPQETTNVYKRARLAAAADNPELETAEKACEVVFISREKLLMIEQDDPSKHQADPNPDDVVRMIEAYNAPHLRNHYCVNQCPLGEGMSALDHENLDRISLRLLVALQNIEQTRDALGNILVDGKISDSEKTSFRQMIATLKNIATQASSLELWAQENGLID